MLIRVPRGWEISDARATDEAAYLNRRRFVRTLGLAGVAAGAAGLWTPAAEEPAKPPAAPAAPSPDAASPLYPARRNPLYTVDAPLTDEKAAASSNIFDEFTSARDGVAEAAKNFRTSPWTIHIGGSVAKAITLDVEELVRRVGLEERVYRHRCVEAWSMVVPWTGFPLKKLVDLAEPAPGAKYLRMLSFQRPEEAPGWYASKRVFPYYEALSLAEATHELAFLSTGIFGHALPPQHGAPLRLTVPWKYGLKSIKSIVAFQFTPERPGTFWNDLSPAKYSFDCNVRPDIPLPWPQAEETVLDTGKTRKTEPYNGYEKFVAHLYA
ncbi:MAG TPA: protein-methionine-sulfoxide reductase catalytic subunit MsrP [Verrucomicrobiae bacterium]|nr:protein-methionine-sulfoxide reductase catalytic subunit MsrP [Verrucomicrobiae bacterium]